MDQAASLTARVNSQTFVGIFWGGTALSLAFFAFRIYVRIKSFRKLYADDFLVFAAWLMLLVSSIIWQTPQSPMYTQYQLSAGTISPTPKIIADEVTFLKTEVATIFLFYCCLWSIKLSFLIFFRRLGQRVRGQKIWWWFVLALTVVTWATCIGDIQYPCLLNSLEYIMTQCSGQDALNFQWNTLHWNCAADVISDAFIITIPILMLWNVHIPWKQKLGLFSIFSLTVIAIIFSIADISWLYMWSNIEMVVVIIVACLASFRQLFVKAEQTGYVQQSDGWSFWRRGLLSSFRTSKAKGSSGHESYFVRSTSRQNTATSHNSKQHIIPLENIHFSQDIGFQSKTTQDGSQIPRAQIYNSCNLDHNNRRYPDEMV